MVFNAVCCPADTRHVLGAQVTYNIARKQLNYVRTPGTIYLSTLSAHLRLLVCLALLPCIQTSNTA